MPSFMFRSGQDKWSEVQVIHVDETTKRRPIGALSAGSHPPGSSQPGDHGAASRPARRKGNRTANQLFLRTVARVRLTLCIHYPNVHVYDSSIYLEGVASFLVVSMITID